MIIMNGKIITMEEDGYAEGFVRIAKEFDVDITIDHETESHLIVDEVKQSGFPVIVGTDLTSRSKIEVQNMSFKTNKILRDAGWMIE